MEAWFAVAIYGSQFINPQIKTVRLRAAGYINSHENNTTFTLGLVKFFSENTLDLNTTPPVTCCFFSDHAVTLLLL